MKRDVCSDRRLPRTREADDRKWNSKNDVRTVFREDAAFILHTALYNVNNISYSFLKRVFNVTSVVRCFLSL